MTKSTFYHDGYRDALNDREASPPSHPETTVYAREYWAGYRDAMEGEEQLSRLKRYQLRLSRLRC